MKKRLIELLTNAQVVHHAVVANQGVDDTDWARWYAEFLLANGVTVATPYVVSEDVAFHGRDFRVDDVMLPQEVK